MDSLGRTIFVADAQRGDGQRFIVRADEKLTAFVELESTIRAVSSQNRGTGTHYRAAKIRNGGSYCNG